MKGRHLAISIVAAVIATTTAPAVSAESMRLEWIIQGQFAGPIVALDKGYYKEAGVEDFVLQPAGPDLKPTVMVATSVDTFGVGHPNQIIAARANGVPLVMVSQWGQKSATTYVARRESGLTSVADMPGHSVGLWFGGDEHEFMAMLKKAGVDPSQVDMISQGYDIISWLNGDYEVIEVSRYNELLQIYEQGFTDDDLVFLHPEDAGAALISLGLFTTEDEIARHPDVVQAVVTASLRGWQEAFRDPEAAAEIVLKYNSELDLDFQVEQIRQIRNIACAGPTLEGRFGETTAASWEDSQRIILDAGLIDAPIDLATGYTNRFVDATPAEYRVVSCD